MPVFVPDRRLVLYPLWVRRDLLGVGTIPPLPGRLSEAFAGQVMLGRGAVNGADRRNVADRDRVLAADIELRILVVLQVWSGNGLRRCVGHHRGYVGSVADGGVIRGRIQTTLAGAYMVHV